MSMLPHSFRRRSSASSHGYARRLRFEFLEDRKLLNSDGTVTGFTELADNLNGGPSLSSDDYFGRAASSLQDLDGDGINELVVGAPGDDTGGQYRGAAHILFLNSDGTAKSTTKIASGTNGGPTLQDFGKFGTGLGSVGDLDGDGVEDLVVGAYQENAGGLRRGAAYVMLLNSNGSAKSVQKLEHGVAGLSLTDFSFFGTSAAGLGDLDGDGVRDLAVGASGDTSDRGAVFVFFMNADGTAKSSVKIGSSLNGGPTLNGNGAFGKSMDSPGDLDGDGVADLAVGAHGSNSVYMLFMNTDGTVKSSQRIANGAGGGPPVGDEFGTGVTAPGDVDGDGVEDLAVGARLDDSGGSNRGAVYVLFMNSDGTVRNFQKIADGVGGGPPLLDSDFFGRSVTGLGDVNGDGALDLAAGADDDDTGGDDRGAAYVLFLTPTAGISVEIAADAFSESAGAAATTATVTRTGSTSEVLTVTLASDDTTEATVPSTVTIASGATTSAPFNIDAVDDAIVDGTQTVTITASASGLSDVTDTVNVEDDDVATMALALAATSISEGDGTAATTATVSRNTETTSALTVNLTSSDTTEATVPASVTIAAGQTTSPPFNIAAVDDALVDGTQTVTITASSTGFVDGTGTVDVTDDDVGATVNGAVINGGQDNRSGLGTFKLSFSEAVTLSGPAELMLHNHTTGAAVDISGATITGNGTDMITWDFSAVTTLANGYYTATLAAAAGLAESSSTLFHILGGDSTGNASVDFGDFGNLATAFNTLGGPSYGPGDMNGDGNVNFGDFGILAGSFNATLTPPNMDFGDAGGTFPTTLPTGARHILGSGLLLGASVDGELDGQPNATATGDGADEDGVTFGTLQAGSGAASITVNATIPATAVLNAWVDFNNDSDWDDAGEQIFNDQALSGGTNNLTAAIPSSATVGQVTARFRVSSLAGYGPSGLATDGEVEDYQVTIVSARPQGRQIPAALANGRFEFVADGSGESDKSSRAVDSVEPNWTATVDLALAEVVAPDLRPTDETDDPAELDQALVDLVHEQPSE